MTVSVNDVSALKHTVEAFVSVTLTKISSVWTVGLAGSKLVSGVL